MSKFFHNENVKMFRSDDFNYNFLKNTGYTEFWGKTKDDDPDVFPFPLICDFEITTACYGPGGSSNKGGPCKFCYKGNTAKGEYTSFETAKKIIDKLPEQLTQIAFGVDATLETNPDWYKIFSYAREVGIIPNVTVANISDETADELVSVCGAVAISRYHNKNWCYDSVKRLTDRGMEQVNIHMMICKENLESIHETIEDVKNDPRLSKMNALVFLSLKKKGRGLHFNSLSEQEFSDIIEHCDNLGISYGFDSCSFHKWKKYIINSGKDTEILKYGEPCESSLGSVYSNVRGEYFPCSFTEGTPGWETGISILDCNDFIEDVWNHPKTRFFREFLLENKRECPIYNI